MMGFGDLPNFHPFGQGTGTPIGVTMTAVVITVHDGKGGVRDLELPGDIPVSGLGPAIAQAIQHPDLPDDGTQVKIVLKFKDTHDVISLDKSLEHAGVVHGDQLQLLLKEIPLDLAESDICLRFSGPGFVHHSGEAFAFQGSNILIGRVDRSQGVVSRVLGVDLTNLEDPEDHSVSRRHAQVLLREGAYLLQDLKSTNGTKINSRTVPSDTRLPLKHGDEVQIGDIVLFFIWDSQEDGEKIAQGRSSHGDSK
jgi:uncharacterized ubiquitin-like protein YukD